MNRIALILVALSLIVAIAAPAHAQRKIKDSVDYALDDGIMSKEEMEMEAQDMYMMCERNAWQRIYFNCGCYAGAFLQQREKLGPTVMQHQIHKIISNSRQTDPSCVNVGGMAANVYDECLALVTYDMKTELASDNDEYCTCAANKATNDFQKNPRLVMPYIDKLKMNAFSYCKLPQNRKPAGGQSSAIPGPPVVSIPPKTAN